MSFAVSIIEYGCKSRFTAGKVQTEIQMAVPMPVKNRLTISGWALLSLFAGLGVDHASASQLKTLYSFCSKNVCADGQTPVASLSMDRSGSLYGTTLLGGTNGAGTVFELQKTKQGWKYKVLHSFCSDQYCLDGKQPSSKLIIDSQGNLYGTTPFNSNPGKVFELKRARNWEYKLLHAFCSADNCSDGPGSPAGLAYDGAEQGLPYDGISPLYGTTNEVSSFPSTVFELLPNGKKPKFRTIYTFCSKSGCSDGDNSIAPLLVDTSGNLLGTTEDGGQAGKGTVVQLNRKGNSWQEKVLYSFCSLQNCTDGSYLGTALKQDASGNILGTTFEGGKSDPHCEEALYSQGCGVVFKLSPNGAIFDETILSDFCVHSGCLDGAVPEALSLNSTGQVFGSTAYGGYANDGNGYGAGTVFVLGSKREVLYRFCADAGCPDGSYPSSLIADSSGHLYGITSSGGANGDGTIFEFTP